MLRIFRPESQCDEGMILSILASGPRSIREIGNRLRKRGEDHGNQVGATVRRLAKRGVITGRKDERRNAWVYQLATYRD